MEKPKVPLGEPAGFRGARKPRRIRRIPRASRPVHASRAPERPIPQDITSRFWALLRGEEKPADNEERLNFGRIAYDHAQFTLATQLYSEALESDWTLGDDRETQIRYNAACVASLTAAGQGYDEPPMSDAEKSKLRHQAFDWLKAELNAELNAWARLLESDSPEIRSTVVETLNYWKNDTDLVSIRDPAALVQLPADEQAAFTRFWADVEALLKEAEKTLPPKEGK